MNITPESIAKLLTEAEAAREEAMRAAHFHDGRAAQLRQLATMLSQPEPEAQPVAVSGGG